MEYLSYMLIFFKINFSRQFNSESVEIEIKFIIIIQEHTAAAFVMIGNYRYHVALPNS